MGTRVIILLVVLAVCVQCLPVEPKFRQMSLQAQESQTSAEIQTISARITFLEKLNKLTYDTTLFTRKLRWLLRRSLTEKPTVAEVAELMSKELEISKAQIEVAVEGVADELKLEVKQGIIALKAGLAFIEDNYKAGSDPQADAIIAKIKANLAALEARFGKKGTIPVPVPESTAEATPAVESSTAEAAPVEQSSTSEAPPAPVESSTTEVPVPVPESSTTQAVPPPTESTGGSLIGSETAVASTTEVAPAASTTEVPAPVASTTEVPAPVASTSETAPPEASTTQPPVELGSTAIAVLESTGAHNETNSSSSSTGDAALAESLLSSTSAFF